MTDNQLTFISAGDLLSNCQKLKNEDYRIVQICAVRTHDGYELTYSFANGYVMTNLRLVIMEDEEVMSISNIYSPSNACTYTVA